MNHKVSFQNEIDSLISLFSKGYFQKALNVSLNLIESYPEESILLNIGGACYAGLSQHDSAINFYQKSISKNINVGTQYIIKTKEKNRILCM